MYDANMYVLAKETWENWIFKYKGDTVMSWTRQFWKQNKVVHWTQTSVLIKDFSVLHLCNTCTGNWDCKPVHVIIICWCLYTRMYRCVYLYTYIYRFWCNTFLTTTNKGFFSVCRFSIKDLHICEIYTVWRNV